MATPIVRDDVNKQNLSDTCTSQINNPAKTSILGCLNDFGFSTQDVNKLSKFEALFVLQIYGFDIHNYDFDEWYRRITNPNNLIIIETKNIYPKLDQFITVYKIAKPVIHAIRNMKVEKTTNPIKDVKQPAKPLVLSDMRDQNSRYLNLFNQQLLNLKQPQKEFFLGEKSGVKNFIQNGGSMIHIGGDNSRAENYTRILNELKITDPNLTVLLNKIKTREGEINAFFKKDKIDAIKDDASKADYIKTGNQILEDYRNITKQFLEAVINMIKTDKNHTK